MKQERNYKFFKKRVAEMDIYQEYRRSHDRVKVMLNEKEEMFIAEDSGTPVSAQENLRNFIKQHEASDSILESELSSPTEEELDQAFIDLKQDTIINPILPETQSDSYQLTPQDRYIFQKQNYDYEYLINQNAPLSNESGNYESAIQNNSTIEEHSINYKEHQEQYTKLKSGKVEDELETIIREALTNFNPASNIQSSDIDPELLKMVKEFIFTNNMPRSFSESLFNSSPLEQQTNQNTQTNNVNQFEFAENSSIKTPNMESLIKKEPNLEIKNNDAAILEKQIQNQQVPPKIPTSKTTVKRPGIPESIGPLETTFSATDYEDDSSLALTKNELKMQVRNLIRESLAESETENTPKPNDLLQLEKQLKEHIEKLKQSRKV